MLIRAANIENISLPALVFWTFVIHQPLVIVLGLLYSDESFFSATCALSIVSDIAIS